MIKVCVKSQHLGNEKNWRRHWRDRGTLETFTVQYMYGYHNVSPNHSMCIRLAFDDPIVLALIEEEANYQQELREYDESEQVSDSGSDGGVTGVLSGQPLSITLVAEGDILVSGNANIQNFKDDKHPDEIQNLLFVAGGDIDLDGSLTNSIDGIVVAGEQVSMTANANLSGYVIASDIFEESSTVTESKILENFTVTYNDLKNPFLNDQTKILSWKQ